MSIQVKEGDNIPLSLQLYDGATNKYVRAIIKDPTDVQLAGSPASLSHIGEGMYKNSALVMPLKDYLTVTYKVFQDALFTIPDTNYSETDELVTLLVPVAELIEILEKIDQILSEGVVAKGVGFDLVGEIGANELSIEVDDSNLISELYDYSAIGKIDEPTALVGYLIDEDTEAIIGCSQGGI